MPLLLIGREVGCIRIFDIPARESPRDRVIIDTRSEI